MASLFGQYLRDQADWRDQVAREYPDDVRNVKAAHTLRAWADWYDDLDSFGLVKMSLELDPFDLGQYEPSEESEQFIKDAPFRDWIRDFKDATLWIMEKDQASRTTLKDYRTAVREVVGDVVSKLSELVTVLEELDYDAISSYGKADDYTIVDLHDLPEVGELIDDAFDVTGADEYVDSLALRNRITATVWTDLREKVAA